MHNNPTEPALFSIISINEKKQRLKNVLNRNRKVGTAKIKVNRGFRKQILKQCD